MKTTVTLQEPYKYSLIYIITTTIILALLIAYTIYLKNKKKTIVLENKEIKAIPQKIIKDIPKIKEKYMTYLSSIEYKYKNKMIDLRLAYQQISECMRLFVYEAYDLKTLNSTLSEIKNLNIPVLYHLIEEYYEPEFARKTVRDFDISLKKARDVILNWKK